MGRVLLAPGLRREHAARNLESIEGVPTDIELPRRQEDG